jgi:hypothetical protein
MSRILVIKNFGETTCDLLTLILLKQINYCALHQGLEVQWVVQCQHSAARRSAVRSRVAWPRARLVREICCALVCDCCAPDSQSRALYSQSRALCSQCRALYSQCRALCSQCRALYSQYRVLCFRYRAHVILIGCVHDAHDVCRAIEIWSGAKNVFCPAIAI